ncbi:MAG: TlpA disulfide reductase family protein [Dehalococcoidia bacterium]|nr:TlpA disulfide reductase family protein [Dehalococcoidia bacterium]
MGSSDEERPPGEAEFTPLGPALPDEAADEPPDIPEEDEELLFPTPFRRPRVSALRNILATIAVGAIIVGLVWFFDRPDAAGVQAINLSASPTGPAPRLGHEAPNFSLRTLDGKDVQLSDYRGRPVWINFWATWCPPCRAETPDIQEVYEAHESDGLVVLAISIGESPSTVSDYVKRTGTTFTTGVDQATSIAAQYRIVGIPTHFFIDREGVIREWRIGSMSKKTMESKVREIMSPAAAETER